MLGVIPLKTMIWAMDNLYGQLLSNPNYTLDLFPEKIMLI